MTRFVFRFTHVKHLGHPEFISGFYGTAVKFDYQIISCLPRYAMLERLTVLGAELQDGVTQQSYVTKKVSLLGEGQSQNLFCLRVRTVVAINLHWALINSKLSITQRKLAYPLF